MLNNHGPTNARLGQRRLPSRVGSSLTGIMFIAGCAVLPACSSDADPGAAQTPFSPTVPQTNDPGFAGSPVAGQGATQPGSVVPDTIQPQVPSNGAQPVAVPPGNAPGAPVAAVPVDGAPVAPPAVPPMAAVEEAPMGPTAGRRLTKQEFVNTVGDLFGANAAEGAQFIESEGAAQSRFRNDLLELTVSSQRITDYETVAQSAAAETPWPQIARFASCTEATSECQQGFVAELGRHLYRRPLVDSEATRLGELFQLDAVDSFESGARLVVQAMLQSPFFLYRLEKDQAQPDGYEMATRLSYLLWQSGPDTALLDLAASGGLSTPEGVSQTAMQMFDDERSRRGVIAFADDWLRVYNNLERLADDDLGLSDDVFSAMRQETLDFVVRVLMDDAAPISQLLSDQNTSFDDRLAKFYGIEPSENGEYDFSAEPTRVGLLTQLAVLGSRAGPQRASIVDRGLTVVEDFLCVEIPPPPAAVATQVAEFEANFDDTASEREKLAQHNLESGSCAGCHSLIDPYGLPFENYDVTGRFAREDEFGNVLQGNGSLVIDQQQQDYANVAEFAQILAQSPSTHRCLTQKFIQYGLGRKVTGTDVSLLDVVFQRSMAEGGTYRNWVSALVGSESFRAAAPRVE